MPADEKAFYLGAKGHKEHQTLTLSSLTTYVCQLLYRSIVSYKTFIK